MIVAQIFDRSIEL